MAARMEEFIVSLEALRDEIDIKSQRERVLLDQLRVVRAEELELLDELAKAEDDLCVLRIKANSDANPSPSSNHISRLPNELLSTIFQEAKDAYDGVPRIELSVSQVSRRWRDIAQNTSSMWKTIHISPSSSTLSLAGMYLVRSGSQPVDLHLNYLFEDGTDLRQRLVIGNNMAEEALWCIDRWHRLTIKADQDIDHLLSRFGALHAPNLQHISLDIPHDNGSHPLSLLAGGVPRLTSLNVTNILPTSLAIPLHRNNLSSLVMSTDCGGYDTFCNVLLNFHALTHLTLHRNSFIFLGANVIRTVVMSNLRSLLVTGYGHVTENLLVTLKTISAPNLEEFVLDLSFHRMYKYLYADDIRIPFLRNPPVAICHSLRSLTLDLPIRGADALFWLIEVLPKDVESITLPHDSFVMRALLLNAIPSTEHYEWPPLCVPPVIVHPDESDADDSFGYEVDLGVPEVQSQDEMMWLAQRINDNYGNTLWWPTLHTLVFKEPHFSFHFLLRLLQARKKAGKPISTLRFQGPGKKYSSSFRQMVTNGLRRHVAAIEFE